MDEVEPNWKKINMKQFTDEDILTFLRQHCTFSVDINTKDTLMQQWIYTHKHLIKTGKE